MKCIRFWERLYLVSLLPFAKPPWNKRSQNHLPTTSSSRLSDPKLSRSDTITHCRANETFLDHWPHASDACLGSDSDMCVRLPNQSKKLYKTSSIYPTSKKSFL